jgi:hypothetical protein
MPGKHHQSSFVARHRYPLIVGAVLVCIAVAGTLAAVSNRRDPEPPLLVTPVRSASSPTVSATPSGTPSPSAEPSRSPSARPSSARSPSARPSPSRTSAAGSFAARYVAMTSRRRSTFQAGIFITNEGRTARTWQLVIAHDPDDGVRVQGGAGARMTVSGNTVTFDGGPLDPGDTVTVGYRATTTTEGSVRPASCRIEGRSCEISERRYRNESRDRRG